ncbi:MAG: M23 family metallopeptidase [Oscillospiraceae bacterium]|nr:M23 family metallopeptidase [Oscillospiraceae bacterium]
MMERSHGQRTVKRRRGQQTARPAAKRAGNPKTRRLTCKLIICAALFLFSALSRLLFPGFFEIIGNSVTTAVDYRTAFSILGEGISGERQFIEAIGEAFTYAFRISPGEPEATNKSEEDDASPLFRGLMDAGDSPSPQNAVVTAFLETQASFAHLSLPAGATFEMPELGMVHASPVSGEIISRFGFGEDPIRGGISFSHGVIIAADEGTPTTAFSAGEVIAAGESATLGNFIIITHDGAETRYGHLSEIFVYTGQMVQMGDEIAKSGSGGSTVGSGLHFELRIGGIAVNPEFYIFAG